MLQTHVQFKAIYNIVFTNVCLNFLLNFIWFIIYCKEIILLWLQTSEN